MTARAGNPGAVGVRRPVVRLLRYGRGAYGRLTLAALLGVVASGCAVGLGATSAWLIARAAQHPPVLYLMVAVTAVRAFGIFRGVGRYAERLTGHDAALRILGRLRVGVYRRLEGLAPAGLDAFRSGDLTSRLVSDVDELADVWLRVLLPYAVAIVVGAGTVTLVATLLPAAGVLLAVTLVLVAVVAPWLAGRSARTAERRIAPRRGELSTATYDTLRGAAELIAYGAADAAMDRVRDRDAALSRAQRRTAAGLGVSAAVSALAVGAAVWGALLAGIPAVRAGSLSGLPMIQGGSLSGVALAVVVLTPLAVHEIFAALPAAAQQIPRLRAAARRVFAVLESPGPVTEPAAPADPPEPPYDLRVAGLRARWTPDGPDVLRGIDLAVPAGHRVAVVGRSGAGKSTLAAVLLRFLDPSAGRVLLGGVDTATLDGDAVRRVVGLCAQDAYVFDSTIGANVRLADPDAGDGAIIDALSRARLWDWVAGLPQGLDTPVGEHGVRLSGGQRQRLALARTLLAGFPVVVLDEPTEHLDEPTAAALTRDLLAATEGRTVLLITHRKTGLDACDAVYTLE